jgi:hypothetical protein
LFAEDLGLVALPLAPAQIHPQQDVRPVLGLGPAGPGVDRHDRVGVVIGSQHPLQLQRPDASLEGRELFRDFGEHRRVLLLAGELQQIEQVASLAVHVFEAFERFLGAGAFPHELLGLLLVVPEALGAAEVRQPIDAVSQSVEVKDTSPALACAV